MRSYNEDYERGFRAGRRTALREATLQNKEDLLYEDEGYMKITGEYDNEQNAYRITLYNRNSPTLYFFKDFAKTKDNDSVKRLISELTRDYRENYLEDHEVYDFITMVRNEYNGVYTLPDRSRWSHRDSDRYPNDYNPYLERRY